MGEVVSLKPATVPAPTFLTVSDCAGPGDLRVVLGKADWPDGSTHWVIVIRAPGAPDLGVADGPWPECDIEDESEVAALYMRLVQATLQIARTRVPALTAGAPPDQPEGVA